MHEISNGQDQNSHQTQRKNSIQSQRVNSTGVPKDLGLWYESEADERENRRRPNRRIQLWTNKPTKKARLSKQTGKITSLHPNV